MADTLVPGLIPVRGAEFGDLARDGRAVNDRLRGLDPPDDLRDELDGLTSDLDAGIGDSTTSPPPRSNGGSSSG